MKRPLFLNEVTFAIRVLGKKDAAQWKAPCVS
jgi:hypothetical protein